MNKRIDIFILIDALGWEFIKDRPFLDDIAVTKQQVKSILGFSSGVIPSILTGQYPQKHNHWSLFYYSPETSPFRWTKFLHWLPRPVLRSRITRKIIEEISRRLMGYTGYFETYLIPVEQLCLFDICEKKSIYKSKGIESASSVFDRWDEAGINYATLTYPLKDKEIFDKAKELINSSANDRYFLYFAEFDALLHASCKDKEKVDQAIDFYEAQIREIYDTASKKYTDVNLSIFSDHGMAAVVEEVDLKKQIDNLGFLLPHDYVAFYDSTMARFWYFTPEAKEKITALLREQSFGHLLSVEEIANNYVDFKRSRYGESIFLINTGTVINPSHMGSKAPHGMHGFNINHPSMDAALVSNKHHDGIRDVKDFFGLMIGGLNKKIKVLYFLNSTVRGGVEEHTLQLLNNIDRNLFEPVLVCPQDLLDLIQKDLKQPVNVYAITIRRWRNIKNIAKFIQILKKEKPDIVHSHLFFATRFAAPLAKWAGIPTVIETGRFKRSVGEKELKGRILSIVSTGMWTKSLGFQMWRKNIWLKKNAFLLKKSQLFITESTWISLDLTVMPALNKAWPNLPS